MYLPRMIDAVLKEWSLAKGRKPMVLRGARQTGKSTSVRMFGKTAPAFVELNFERSRDRELARACRNPQELLQALLVRHNMAAFPPGGVLFLDEIQQVPEAIPWLRFFHEDHPEIAVVAAGSLLEVGMAERGFSFPVGRVTFRTIRPLSFLEFARAVGRDVLANVISGSVRQPGSLVPPVHEEAMRVFGDYLLVGGMPEAVARWSEDHVLVSARRVHADLREAFIEDIGKYGSGGRVVERMFQQLPAAYGLRFKYESLVPDLPSKVAHAVLDKLERAELVHRALPTSSNRPPIRVRTRSAPKLLPLDVGMALSDLSLPPETLRSSDAMGLLDGRIAECFVGQQFLARPDCSAAPLHFWVRESSTAAAETDFLVHTGALLLPIEVKSGKAGSLKSLHQFLWRSKGDLGIRLNSAPPIDEPCEVRMPDGPLRFRLLSLPLYCAELLPSLRPDAG